MERKGYSASLKAVKEIYSCKDCWKSTKLLSTASQGFIIGNKLFLLGLLAILCSTSHELISLCGTLALFISIWLTYDIFKMLRYKFTMPLLKYLPEASSPPKENGYKRQCKNILRGENWLKGLALGISTASLFLSPVIIFASL
ncbi:hypothetical protein KFE96_16125 [Kordiimonas sp. SCSIO 12603]|uniref:hypothetical protein n=1 Tax=Kordiimonas sp. SCSIO 12603 TaxID=2829596 RepID=UPI0021070E27|nr:hypothetical protein [Kordiimonas sp. SCSIO 12603]UTW58330.1 hypothetical protein KFE96_16125 [Kordiimonas sp. SCSIO 12603]